MDSMAEDLVADRVKPRPAWAAVWALALTVAALNASEMLPASLLTPMAASLDASEGMIGQSVTATALLAIVTSLFVGRVTRRFDRRNVLLVAAVAQVASNLIVALAPNAVIMLTGRVLLGFTVGAVWGLSASLALRLVPADNVSRALSIIFGGGSVAMVAAAPLGAFLGGMIGWRGVFFAATALAALAVVALALTLPKLPSQQASASTGLATTLRLPGLAVGMVGVILLFGGQSMFVTYLRPFLEGVAGFMTDGVALTLLVFGITTLLGTLVAPPLLARSIRWTLAGAALIVAAALALLWSTASSSQVAVIACIAVWGFAGGAFGVGWSSWLARTYPDHAEAGGGILVAAIQGSMMFGAMLGGGLIDTIGATGPLIASIAILAVGAIHTAIALRPRSAAFVAAGR